MDRNKLNKIKIRSNKNADDVEALVSKGKSLAAKALSLQYLAKHLGYIDQIEPLENNEPARGMIVVNACVFAMLSMRFKHVLELVELAKQSVLDHRQKAVIATMLHLATTGLTLYPEKDESDKPLGGI